MVALSQVTEVHVLAMSLTEQVLATSLYPTVQQPDVLRGVLNLPLRPMGTLLVAVEPDLVPA